jgi:hypothetical protein
MMPHLGSAGRNQATNSKVATLKKLECGGAKLFLKPLNRTLRLLTLIRAVVI